MLPQAAQPLHKVHTSNNVLILNPELEDPGEPVTKGGRHRQKAQQMPCRCCIEDNQILLAVFEQFRDRDQRQHLINTGQRLIYKLPPGCGRIGHRYPAQLLGAANHIGQLPKVVNPKLGQDLIGINFVQAQIGCQLHRLIAQGLAKGITQRMGRVNRDYPYRPLGIALCQAPTHRGCYRSFADTTFATHNQQALARRHKIGQMGRDRRGPDNPWRHPLRLGLNGAKLRQKFRQHRHTQGRRRLLRQLPHRQGQGLKGAQKLLLLIIAISTGLGFNAVNHHAQGGNLELRQLRQKALTFTQAHRLGDRDHHTPCLGRILQQAAATLQIAAQLC